MADLQAELAVLRDLVAVLEAEWPVSVALARELQAADSVGVFDATLSAMAMGLARTLDGGSVPLASAGIAKQLASLLDRLAVAAPDEEATNPLAEVLSLQK